MDEMHIKACFSGLPTSWGGGGWGWVDELQNKAEAQPACVQLASGA